VSASARCFSGTLVPFDRSNHKSNHRSALVLGGGIPIYHGTAGRSLAVRSATFPRKHLVHAL